MITPAHLPEMERLLVEHAEAVAEAAEYDGDEGALHAASVALAAFTRRVAAEPPPAPVGMEAIEAAVADLDDAAYDHGEKILGDSRAFAGAREGRRSARDALLATVRAALAARDERVAALEAAMASQREGAMERIRELTARADALAVLVTDGGCDHRHRCTCGSGGHPRECKRHPNAYRHHVAELNAIGSVEAGEAEARLAEAIAESMEQRERIAALEAGLADAFRAGAAAAFGLDEAWNERDAVIDRKLAEYLRALADAGKVGA